MHRNLILFIIIIFSNSCFADDSSYKKIKKEFWGKLYNLNYETFYCGLEKDKGQLVTIEHVYPASWIASHLGCKDRNNCKNDIYRAASSDLHNLWPAQGRYNKSRSNLPFGEIKGEEPRFKGDACDFERTTGKNAVVEPRDEVKGQIARTILYMIHWYELPHKDLLPLLIKWNVQYPVTKEEKRRNKLIFELQGNINPFIGDAK